MPKNARPLRLLASAVLAFACTTCDEEPPSAPRKARRPAAAGVVTSATPAVLVGAGDIASCTNTRDALTAELLDGIAGTVFTAGDNAYSSGTATEYAACYDPTWGRHNGRTFPAAGERDYTTANAPSYFGYFGPAAGNPTTGYYSYDLGEWHVIVLNSNLSLSATSPQVQWLKADLGASTRECTVAYWHSPRFFSSGSSGVSSTPKPVWDVLWWSGVELVVNAHYRFYERFAPQTPDGAADPDFGVRQFIVGTGGAGTTSFGTIRPNSEARSSGAAGVLKLTLDAGSYHWEFVPVAGQVFTDAGAGTCHGSPPPVAKPGGPYRSEATVTLDASASSDPQGDTPLSYLWDFGDATTGSGANPTHTYTAVGVYTVTLTVSDSAGNASAPATTTATIANLPPAVLAGPVKRSQPGLEVRLDARFNDPAGDADGPFSYRIAWGDGLEDVGSASSQSGPLLASHTYAALGQYPVYVDVTDREGGTGTDSLTVLVEALGTPQVLLGAGDIADCTTANRDEKTAQLLDQNAGTVFTFGDNAYKDGSAADYANCYHPTWGRHRDRTYAQLGNHEYVLGNADGSYDYFASAVGPRGKGYYSLDLGDWHVVVLNDNSSFVRFAAGSEQDLWLQNDLATNPKLCTLAIWHGPYFRSSRDGTTKTTSRKILWDRLYAAGAELVLNGHYHQYERFAPQTPDGIVDLVAGIREIIVGTGGESSLAPATIAPNSEARAKAFGIIKLTLTAAAYTWEFLPASGETFTDSGFGTCH